jgi:signal transduction histidine kinase/CheY-like chemotaxis protein
LRIKYFTLTSALFIICSLKIAAQSNAEKGIIDLRQTDLSNKTITLSGEWQFYWQQLLTQPNLTEVPTYVTLPQLWTATQVQGKNLPAQGYATYMLTLLLPSKHDSLAAVLVPDFYTAFNLYANGKLVAKDGQVGTNKNEEVPHWSTQIVPLQTNADTVQLCLQISNFTHAKGGIAKLLQIGNYNTLTLKNKQHLAQDMFLGGCLFMGGLFFLGLFMFSRNDRAILFFALFCIFYSYRIVGAELYALHTIFPSLPFGLTIRLEYISLCGFVICFAHYVEHLFPQESNRRISFLFIGISALYGITALLTPPIFFTSFINYYLVVLLVYIVYGMYVFVRAWQHKQPGAQYGFWSGVVILVLFLITLLNYFAILPQYRITQLIGYVAFFFLQALVLSYRSSFKLILARQQAEEGLVAKSRFLSTMSHEIRTPLNAVLGLTQLLQKDTKNLTTEQQQYLQALDFSGVNLMKIVNNVLDYSKLEAGKATLELNATNIKTLLQNIETSYKKAAADKNITFTTEAANTLPEFIMADATKLSQVLFNLVGNAIKFTNVGHVKLLLQNASDTTTPSNHCGIKFIVEDTGIGIKSQQLQAIFEPFAQADSSTNRSYGGTGLGLAICRQILHLQQTELHLNSQTGKGTKFFFTQTFSMPTSAQNVTTDITVKPLLPFKPENVLLVEDNAINVMVAKKMLEKWGLSADVAVDGHEAVSNFDAAKHKLILMDLQMPGMDGYEATRTIRKQYKDVPIIALTAETAEDIKADILTAGMNDLVLKPFKQNDLHAALQKYLTH